MNAMKVLLKQIWPEFEFVDLKREFEKNAMTKEHYRALKLLVKKFAAVEMKYNINEVDCAKRKITSFFRSIINQEIQ